MEPDAHRAELPGLPSSKRMEPKRERTLYEISSSFFAVVVIAFAIGGMLVVGFGPDGPISGEFGDLRPVPAAGRSAASTSAWSAARRARED